MVYPLGLLSHCIFGIFHFRHVDSQSANWIPLAIAAGLIALLWIVSRKSEHDRSDATLSHRPGRIHCVQLRMRIHAAAWLPSTSALLLAVR